MVLPVSVSDGPGSGRTGLYGLLFRFAGNSVRSASSGPHSLLSQVTNWRIPFIRQL